MVQKGAPSKPASRPLLRPRTLPAHKPPSPPAAARQLRCWTGCSCMCATLCRAKPRRRRQTWQPPARSSCGASLRHWATSSPSRQVRECACTVNMDAKPRAMQFAHAPRCRGAVCQEGSHALCLAAHSVRHALCSCHACTRRLRHTCVHYPLQVAVERDTGRCRNYGFVNFRDQASAARAVAQVGRGGRSWRRRLSHARHIMGSPGSPIWIISQNET